MVIYFYQAPRKHLNNFSLYLALQINPVDLSIAQHHRNEPTYRIREIRHRGQEAVLVGYDYITELYRRYKELGGRYSRTHRGRWWPLSDRVLVELTKYFKMYQPGNYLFEGQSGGKCSNRSAAQVLKRAVKWAGITIRLTLYTLRHSYRTLLSNQGVNIRFLKEIPGHKSSRTAMLYALMNGKGIRIINSRFMGHYVASMRLIGVECGCVNELAVMPENRFQTRNTTEKI